MPNVPHIHAGSDANVANLNAVITAINDELQDILDGTTELTAPQISGFTNAQHAHEAASSGGKLRLASLIATASDEGKVPVPNSSGVVEWQSPAALPIASLLAFAGPETNIPANSCFALVNPFRVAPMLIYMRSLDIPLAVVVPCSTFLIYVAASRLVWIIWAEPVRTGLPIRMLIR